MLFPLNRELKVKDATGAMGEEVFLRPQSKTPDAVALIFCSNNTDISCSCQKIFCPLMPSMFTFAVFTVEKNICLLLYLANSNLSKTWLRLFFPCENLKWFIAPSAPHGYCNYAELSCSIIVLAIL